ncbi:hypothetical protein [Chachezhania sediminis]|uniref:hypothetical protein n=1 Tax=Chachezhania sediminis TaxID=2599291 RepID=UPI00131D1E40|nr:hypothetical protein [Chachezhania sediminis]
MRITALPLLLVLATPALSDVVGPGGKVQDCYCTDRQGARVELGEYSCLRVDGRAFIAQCQMSLNVPMWREIQDGCVSSELDPVDPPVDAGAVHAKV